MTRQRRVRFASVVLAVLLSGCCTDDWSDYFAAPDGGVSTTRDPDASATDEPKEQGKDLPQDLAKESPLDLAKESPPDLAKE
jgi:hypothetical protein